MGGGANIRRCFLNCSVIKTEIHKGKALHEADVFILGAGVEELCCDCRQPMQERY